MCRHRCRQTQMHQKNMQSQCSDPKKYDSCKKVRAHRNEKSPCIFAFFSCFALFWVCLGDASHICHGKHTHIYYIENVVQMMQLHNAFVFLFCISFICILIIRGTRVVLEDSFFRFSVTNHLDFGVSLHSNRRLCEEAV